MLIGTLLAFDRHMNLVLGDCEEQRTSEKRVAGASRGIEQTQKRMLGLILLRGENVVCMQVDSPPRGNISKVPAKPGPGVARPAARGAGMVLGGASGGSHQMGAGVPGLGAPMPSAMRPTGGFNQVGAVMPSSAPAGAPAVGQAHVGAATTSQGLGAGVPGQLISVGSGASAALAGAEHAASSASASSAAMERAVS